MIVIFGAIFGADYIGLKVGEVREYDGLISNFARWDGRHYATIVRDGYSYSATRPSNIAFFPVFPLLAKLLHATCGISSDAALLAVSHLCLAGSFVVMALYARSYYVLLAFGIWPVTFFFRMAYSESCFLLLALLAMYGIKQKWPIYQIAIIVSAATACRAVGVALVLPLAIYIWQTNRRGLPWLFISLWGLILFMAYQYFAFDNPLAFAQTQENFRMRRPLAVGDRLVRLAMLEPLWSTYSPTSDGFWNASRHEPNLLFSLRFANPLYFVSAVGLVVWGWRRRWLDSFELSLAFGLLLIPYVTRGYEFAMASQGRFSVVCFPVFLVMGQLLGAIPQPLKSLLLCLAALFLGMYAALFSAGYPLY